jgi:hypothetical protein
MTRSQRLQQYHLRDQLVRQQIQRRHNRDAGIGAVMLSAVTLMPMIIVKLFG